MNRFLARAAALILASSLVGCGPQDRLDLAAARTRDTQPLIDWVNVRAEHLADVDLARFKAEGSALLVTRSVREADDGAPAAGRDSIMIRDVATSTIRATESAVPGGEPGTGWRVMVVRPGQYALNRGAVRQTITTRNGEARTTYVDSAGHPFVPLEATTRVGAGEVVYIGTVVRQVSGSEPTRTVIRDERKAAAEWADAKLPGFAAQLRTRLLPPPVPLLPRVS